MLGSNSPKGYVNIRKSDIIAEVAKKAKTTKKAATEIVNTYWETIRTTIKNNRRCNINIPNVGSIRCITTKARTYSTSGLKNTSKKSVRVGAKTTPKFYVSENFLSSVGKNTKSKKTKTKTTKTKTKATKSKSKKTKSKKQ